MAAFLLTLNIKNVSFLIINKNEKKTREKGNNDKLLVQVDDCCRLKS